MRPEELQSNEGGSAHRPRSTAAAIRREGPARRAEPPGGRGTRCEQHLAAARRARRGNGIASSGRAWYQRAVRSLLRALVAASPAVILLAAGAAHADPTAWTAVGGGAMGWKQGSTTPDFRADGAFFAEVGAGIPSRYPVIVGGLFRVTPLFGSGTGADLAWLARVCTRGYQVGGFGLAADAGVYARTWGTPSQGFAGSLSLGAPLGLSLTFHAMAGSDDLLAFGGSLNLDLLRLTIYRQTLLDVWPNPEVRTHKLPTASSPAAVGLRF